MQNIREAIQRFIYDTGAARFAVQDGRAGVVFADESEFIPLAELGYNANYGFFRQSALPQVASEYTNKNPWRLHPVVADDGDSWQGFAIVEDDGERAFLVGEDWQLADMLSAVEDGLSADGLGEVLTDSDEVFGVAYYSIAEACQVASQYDPCEYPYTAPDEQARLRARLQRNIQRGNLWGVRKDPQGHYRIRATAFRGWLVKKSRT